MAKISVLIPIYNCEEHLAECLNSVLEQSFSDFEVLLINDGTIDSVEHIVEKYLPDTRVKVINCKNCGYGASLNIAIQRALGEYVTIVEANDFIYTDMLLRLYSKKGYDIVKGNFGFYPDDICQNMNLYGEYTINDAPYIINACSNIWSCLYKKDFLIKNNIKFNESKGISFKNIAFCLATFYCATSIYFLNEPLYYHRADADLSNFGSKNNFLAVVKEFNFFDEYLKDKIILPETSAQLLLFRLDAYVNNYKKISKQHENELLMSYKKDLNKLDCAAFYGSRFIKLKDKIKLFLILTCPMIFKFILSIVKKYAK